MPPAAQLLPPPPAVLGAAPCHAAHSRSVFELCLQGKQAGTPRRSQAAVYQPGAWKHSCQKCSRNRSQLHSTGLQCTGRGTEVFFPALAVSQPGCVFLKPNQILRAVHTQHMVTVPVIFLHFDLALRKSAKLLCWCPAQGSAPVVGALLDAVRSPGASSGQAARGPTRGSRGFQRIVPWQHVGTQEGAGRSTEPIGMQVGGRALVPLPLPLSPHGFLRSRAGLCLLSQVPEETMCCSRCVCFAPAFPFHDLMYESKLAYRW